MSSKVFIVLAFLAATVLIVSDAAAENSIQTIPASTFGFVNDLVNPQKVCYYCGYISSGRCKCCLAGAKTAENDKGSVDLVEMAEATAAAGDNVSPQGLCRSCGYISAGICRCCRAAEKPKN